MKKKKLISIAVLLLFWASPALANPNDVDGWLGEWTVKENGQTVTWKIDEKAAGGAAGNWYFAYGIKNPGVDDTEFVIIRMPFIGYEHQYIEMGHSNIPADFPQDLDEYTFLLPIPEDADMYESFTTEPGGKYPVESGVRGVDPGPCAASYLLGADDPRLDILRQFRDQKMASSQTGNEMINMYYEKSEDIIAICEANVFAKWSFKAMIEAIIPVIKIML